jgi:hypothetical protein
MSDLSKRPVVLVVVLLALAGAIAFGWTRYRAMNGVTKENSIQMTPDDLRKAMEH